MMRHLLLYIISLFTVTATTSFRISEKSVNSFVGLKKSANFAVKIN